jgi:hypothetical protein
MYSTCSRGKMVARLAHMINKNAASCIHASYTKRLRIHAAMRIILLVSGAIAAIDNPQLQACVNGQCSGEFVSPDVEVCFQTRFAMPSSACVFSKNGTLFVTLLALRAYALRLWCCEPVFNFHDTVCASRAGLYNPEPYCSVTNMSQFMQIGSLRCLQKALRFFLHSQSPWLSFSYANIPEQMIISLLLPGAQVAQGSPLFTERDSHHLQVLQGFQLIHLFY